MDVQDVLLAFVRSGKTVALKQREPFDEVFPGARLATSRGRASGCRIVEGPMVVPFRVSQGEEILWSQSVNLDATNELYFTHRGLRSSQENTDARSGAVPTGGIEDSMFH